MRAEMATGIAMPFQADPAWHSARSESEKDGPILANIKSSFLVPTAFSAMQ